MTNQIGDVTLRKENVARAVTGFALQEYKFKQLLMASSSSANRESYFQETAAELTASGTEAIKGIPRLAEFPEVRVSWTKKDAYIEKYGDQGTISMEDKFFNDIDVIARTELRIARSITKQVDDEIWDVLTQDQTGTDINVYTISAGNEWDSSTIANRDPVYDIARAITAIQQSFYPIRNGNGFLLVNDLDYTNIITNSKVSNNPSFRALSNLENGKVSEFMNLSVISSESVTADYALVVLAKECGTWKEAMPLTVATIYDEGIKWTIRAWEMGVAQLTNPKAITRIDNTRA